MSEKEFYAYLSLVVSVIGYAPYFISIFNRTCRPHAFTWITWELTVALAFVAQATRNAGPGAWVTGFAVLACAIIAVLAMRYGERRITFGDKVIFGLSLAALPLWLVTNDPLWSVILLVIINYLGFYQTMRKTYHYPFEESGVFYASVVIKFVLGMMALDSYSWVTVLYPANCAISNALFMMMMYWRRATAPVATRVKYQLQGA